MRAVNLIPPDQRRGGVNLAGRSGGAAYVVLGLVCGLAVLALLYGIADHEIGAKQAEADRLSAEAAQAQAQASRLAPYTSFVAMREERFKDVEQLANTRFDWAHVMHELGRVLPSGAALTTLQATVGSSTSSSASSTAARGAAGASSASSSSVTSATPAGSTPTFTIAGCATSQSEVALTMDRLRLIDGVSDVTLQSSAKSGGSSGSSGGGGSGGCPPGGPSFNLQVSFDSLPQPVVKVPPAGVSSVSASSTSSGRTETGSVKTR